MTDYPTALAAALDAQKPSGFAYRYRDALAGGTVIRFNSGHEVNGSRPIEAVPYWLGAPPAPVALTVLQDLSERFSAMHANGDVWITSVAAAKMAQTAATQAQQPAAAVPVEASEDEVSALTQRFKAAARKNLGPFASFADAESHAREALRWRDETRTQQPAAAVPEGYALVPVEDLRNLAFTDFGRAFWTDGAEAAAMRIRALLAATNKENNNG